MYDTSVLYKCMIQLYYPTKMIGILPYFTDHGIPCCKAKDERVPCCLTKAATLGDLRFASRTYAALRQVYDTTV